MRRTAVAFALMICASSAFAGGFQVTAQSARAMGMGLAYTAVGEDAGAIYYNPAALPKGRDLVFGGMVATNSKGEFVSAAGTEKQRDTYTFVPQAYYSQSVGAARVGVGVFAPFGLPIRWENPTTFSGRHTAYRTSLQSITVNPTVAFDVGGLSIGVGADWVHSKIQLERVRNRTFGPGLTFDVADTKLKSDLSDASAWGWNAGLLWKFGTWRFGAAYRSGVDIDHEPKLKITQILTGNAAIDAGVAATIPPAPLDANVTLNLPSSLNLGASKKFGSTTVALEADRTDWSSFSQLTIDVPVAPPPTVRNTNWQDTWAYRVGVETLCGPIICRAGYYKDETPQPLADVGPVFPDADRQGITLGVGLGSAPLTVDIGFVYVLFDDRTTTVASTDALAGTWKTTGNELAVNLHWHP